MVDNPLLPPRHATRLMDSLPLCTSALVALGRGEREGNDGALGDQGND
jgi:hypothetical protein